MSTWIIALTKYALRSRTPRSLPCQGYYGCINSETGDKAAFRNMLTRTVGSGECRIWQKGESVFKQIGGFTQFCLRAPGAEECYWTAREAVED